MGDRHESDEEGIWRRCRVRSRPDANADPDSEPESVGTKPDTESEPDANACDANSGAIGITESEPNTVDISGADSEHDAGTESVGTDSDTKHDVGTKSEHDTVGNTGADTHAVDNTGTESDARATPAPTASDRRHYRKCGH